MGVSEGWGRHGTLLEIGEAVIGTGHVAASCESANT